MVMVVKDLKRGSKVDYEPTKQHYEDIFRQLDLAFVRVMPFGQLRREFSGFECRRKLASTYDYFLCDGRLAGHVNGICGQPFQRSRTTFHAVRMGDDSSTWKAAIERALKRTAFRQLHKGNLTSIPVATCRHSPQEVAANVFYVVQQLRNAYPGGWPNIRGMYLKLDIRGVSSIPVYLSLMGPPPKTPQVIGLREKRLKKMRQTINKSLSRMAITKSGKIVKLSHKQLVARENIKQTRAALMQEKAKKALKPSADATETTNQEVKASA